MLYWKDKDWNFFTLFLCAPLLIMVVILIGGIILVPLGFLLLAGYEEKKDLPAALDN